MYKTLWFTIISNTHYYLIFTEVNSFYICFYYVVFLYMEDYNKFVLCFAHLRL